MSTPRRDVRDDSVWGRTAPTTEGSVLANLASLAEAQGLPTEVLSSADEEAEEKSQPFEVGLSEQFLFRKLA